MYTEVGMRDSECHFTKVEKTRNAMGKGGEDWVECKKEGKEEYYRVG